MTAESDASSTSGQAGMAWSRQKTLATVASPWVTVYAEQWCDDSGNILDYWRVDRPDSVIVLPIHRGNFLLPPPVFRPGIGRATWDFPGGRLPADLAPHEAVCTVLKRELGVKADHRTEQRALNEEPWAVDSSFSSQRLWGFVAVLDDNYSLDARRLGASVPATTDGAKHLLSRLHCLQCRALLMEWLVQSMREEG